MQGEIRDAEFQGYKDNSAFWRELHQLALYRQQHPEDTRLALLVCAATERFADLTLKEITDMLQLTPLDQTRAGQEIFQRGIKQGVRRGAKQGLKHSLKQGQIRMVSVLMEQRFGSLSPAIRNKLARATLQDLEAWIPKRLDANTVEAIFS